MNFLGRDQQVREAAHRPHGIAATVPELLRHPARQGGTTGRDRPFLNPANRSRGAQPQNTPLAVDAHAVPVRWFSTAGPAADGLQMQWVIARIDAGYLLADKRHEGDTLVESLELGERPLLFYAEVAQNPFISINNCIGLPPHGGLRLRYRGDTGVARGLAVKAGKLQEPGMAGTHSRTNDGVQTTGSKARRRAMLTGLCSEDQLQHTPTQVTKNIYRLQRGPESTATGF